MNNYDEIKKLYDNSVIYNNEFICSNCNCRSANNMVNLSKLYKEKLSNA